MYRFADTTQENTVHAARAAAHDFASLSFSDQIIVTAQIIEGIEYSAHHTRPYLYETNAEALQNLLRLRAQRAPLREGIRNAPKNDR